MAAPAIVVRPILAARFTPERVAASLAPPGAWHPFPTYQERSAWGALAPATRTERIGDAETHLGETWPVIPATLFADFQRNGDRSRYEGRYFPRRAALIAFVLGECVEGQGRFVDDIINGVWAICEETTWCFPAHNFRPGEAPVPLPDPAIPMLDLFAAETGALLAWIHYLLADRLAAEAPIIPNRIAREVQARVLIPYHARDDWWWLGLTHGNALNNWTPWILSNVLASTLLLEPDATMCVKAVIRAVAALDRFLAAYHDDGGCDEGTSYWGRAAGSLFDCLETLHSASAGALDGFDLPLVREMGRYLYRMHIGGDWYVNFADASAQTWPESDLAYRYGTRIDDPRLMAQGAHSHRASGRRSSRVDSLARDLAATFNAAALSAADARPPLIRHAWLPGIQVLATREHERSADGLFLAIKGGHNDESHNHNDVGSFIVALDSIPVIIDVGVEAYSRTTFSPERYTIWTMQSAYHNVPLVNGIGQVNGRAYAARDVSCSITDAVTEMALDIAGAYPEEAGITSWRRTAQLERGPNARIVIEDAYTLTHRPGALALHLMLAGDVDAATPGVLRCTHESRSVRVAYDAALFDSAVDMIPTEDPRLRPVWGDRVYRVRLAAREPAAAGSWRLVIARV